MSLRPLACVLLVLPLLAGAAHADEDATLAPTGTRFQTLARTVGEGVRPTAIHPVQGLHASAFPIGSLGVWAQGFGFSLNRHSALYDVEGGAAWRFDHGVSLTASYRMLGFDRGFDSDLEGADFEPGIAAPFIGLAFDF